MDPRPELFGLSDAKRKTIGRWLFGGMVAMFLVGIGLGFGPLFLAVRQLPAFCTSVPVGTSIADAKSLALARGYEVEAGAAASPGAAGAEGRLRVRAPRMAAQVDNPRGCEWSFGPQGLASARYADSL